LTNSPAHNLCRTRASFSTLLLERKQSLTMSPMLIVAK
jgi:hypothetical protein